MDFDFSIGKLSNADPFHIQFTEKPTLLFYPSNQKQFQYLFVKWINGIVEKRNAARVFTFLNNSSLVSQIHPVDNLTLSSFFRFEPEKSNFQKPITFFKALHQSLRTIDKTREQEIHWIVEDLTPIFQSKNKQLFSLLLKLMLSEKSSSGIISGYLPYKFLLKQAIQQSRTPLVDIGSYTELYFTPDDLLFYKTNESMQHIFYDTDNWPLS